MKLSRRAVLRGAGGIAIGLPFLEIMMGSRSQAQAAAAPKRFMMMFAGALSAGTSQTLNYFVPGSQHTGSTPWPQGSAYPLTPGLASLGTY